jgi:hypothetical protein
MSSIQNKSEKQRLWKDLSDIVAGQPTFWIKKDNQWFWYELNTSLHKRWRYYGTWHSAVYRRFVFSSPLEFLLMTGEGFLKSLESFERPKRSEWET